VLFLDDQMFKGRGHSREAALEDLRCEVAQYEGGRGDFPDICYDSGRCPTCGNNADNIGPCFGCEQRICEHCVDNHMDGCERASKGRELLS
jgi:hypothetical protein